MSVELQTVKIKFASLMCDVIPIIQSQFMVWLDEKCAEFKVFGHMNLDPGSDTPKWLKEYSLSLVASSVTHDMSFHIKPEDTVCPVSPESCDQSCDSEGKKSDSKMNGCKIWSEAQSEITSQTGEREMSDDADYSPSHSLNTAELLNVISVDQQRGLPAVSRNDAEDMQRTACDQYYNKEKDYPPMSTTELPHLPSNLVQQQKYVVSQNSYLPKTKRTLADALTFLSWRNGVISPEQNKLLLDSSHLLSPDLIAPKCEALSLIVNTDTMNMKLGSSGSTATTSSSDDAETVPDPDSPLSSHDEPISLVMRLPHPRDQHTPHMYVDPHKSAGFLIKQEMVHHSDSDLPEDLSMESEQGQPTNRHDTCVSHSLSDTGRNIAGLDCVKDSPHWSSSQLRDALTIPPRYRINTVYVQNNLTCPPMKPKGGYSCQFCGKSYSTRAHCKQHERAHAKLYPCLYCEKRFGRKADSKRHMLVHTGEKAFQCRFCKRKFSLKYNCRQHELTHKSWLAMGGHDDPIQTITSA